MDFGLSVIDPIINLFTLWCSAAITIYGITVTVKDFLIFFFVGSILIFILFNLGGIVDIFHRKE